MVVLIVEDDVDQQEMYAEYLEHSGMHVICALDGITAIQKVHARLPDAIVLDLHMPVVGGLDVLRRLKADAATSAIPVVVLSADGIVLGDEAVRAGCHASLQKPCLPSDLEGVLLSVVD